MFIIFFNIRSSFLNYFPQIDNTFFLSLWLVNRFFIVIVMKTNCIVIFYTINFCSINFIPYFLEEERHWIANKFNSAISSVLSGFVDETFYSWYIKLILGIVLVKRYTDLIIFTAPFVVWTYSWVYDILQL